MTVAEEATMPRVRSEEIKVIGKSGQISHGKGYAEPADLLHGR